MFNFYRNYSGGWGLKAIADVSACMYSISAAAACKRL